MKEKYRNNQSTVFFIQYQFVFCSRYRRKVLKGAVEARFRELLEEICKENELVIVALSIEPDYVFLIVDAPPTISPSDIMARVKGVTSGTLRHEFDKYSHLPSLWTRSFFCSTENTPIPEEIIQWFVGRQKTRG